jgi:cytoplasmic iron level regulating protein YaaA (DUF328/UPF0246 family)
MGARLGDLGRLSRWWRPAVATCLGPLADECDVVDLLPAEHADAWPSASPNVIRVRFEEVAGDGASRRASGHGVKAVKGRLARHLLERRGGVRRALTGFAADGWHLDADASRLTERAGAESVAVYVAG